MNFFENNSTSTASSSSSASCDTTSNHKNEATNTITITNPANLSETACKTIVENEEHVEQTSDCANLLSEQERDEDENTADFLHSTKHTGNQKVEEDSAELSEFSKHEADESEPILPTIKETPETLLQQQQPMTAHIENNNNNSNANTNNNCTTNSNIAAQSPPPHLFKHSLSIKSVTINNKTSLPGKLKKTNRKISSTTNRVTKSSVSSFIRRLFTCGISCYSCSGLRRRGTVTRGSNRPNSLKSNSNSSLEKAAPPARLG